MAVTTGAIRHAKLQSNHHHQKTNTQLFTHWMMSPNEQCQSTKGKYSGDMIKHCTLCNVPTACCPIGLQLEVASGRAVESRLTYS